MKITKSESGYNIEGLTIKELIDIRIGLEVRIYESCHDLTSVKKMEQELCDYLDMELGK